MYRVLAIQRNRCPSATGFTRVTGPNGEQYRYVIANGGTTASPSYTLSEWNSTKLWSWTGLSPAADTSSVAPISGSSSYSYNYYFTPTYTPISTTSTLNGVSTTTITNYTAITAAINASVWNLADAHTRFDWNVSITLAKHHGRPNSNNEHRRSRHYIWSRS